MNSGIVALDRGLDRSLNSTKKGTSCAVVLLAVSMAFTYTLVSTSTAKVCQHQSTSTNSSILANGSEVQLTNSTMMHLLEPQKLF